MAQSRISLRGMSRGPISRSLILIVLATAMVSCRTTGDFGRPKPSYFHDQVVPSLRVHVSTLSGVDASAYPLTPSEVELRSRSIAIIENGGPSIRRSFDAFGVKIGAHEPSYQKERRVEHSTGTADLDHHEYPRHPRVLLAAVSDDLDLLHQFSGVTQRVYAQDKKRLLDLRKGGDVPAHDVLDTTGRVRENRGIVEDTILALHNRIDDYEIELRRSVLVHPDGQQAQVKNAIGRLAKRVKRFEGRVRAIADPKGRKHHSGLLG